MDGSTRQQVSWVTLCTGLAAVRAGGLPPWAAGPPLLRYALLLTGLRRATYRHLNTNHPAWARHTGMALMLLYLAALAPFGGRFTRGAVRLTTPVILVLQPLSQIEQLRRKLRSAP